MRIRHSNIQVAESVNHLSTHIGASAIVKVGFNRLRRFNHFANCA